MSRRPPPASRSRASARRAPAPSGELDRFALYELCAQAPARDVRMLEAIHGGTGRHAPRVLGEDFSGTAALSAAWAGLSDAHKAIAVDHDAPTLARAHRHPRVRLAQADVNSVRQQADVIAVLNFSIGEFHRREALVSYFRHALSRLRPHGCLVLDTYGGVDAFATGQVHQSVRGRDGSRIRYTWEQRTGDSLSGQVACAMHFTVRPAAGQRGPVRKFTDAFVYHWRLWSVPEFRDALLEAGFGQVEIYPRQPDAIDGDGNFHLLPITDAHEIGDSYSVYVVGRREGPERKPPRR